MLALATGTLAFAGGTLPEARYVAIVHGAVGLGLLVLVPWKSVIVRRAQRRRGPRAGRVEGITLGVLLLVSVAAGVLHALAGYERYGPVTAMQVHVGAALLAIPLVVLHVVAHPQRPRRTDLSRRVVLRTLGIGAASAAVYAAVEGVTSALRLPGADRRGTGSHEVGWGRPRAMPVTQWFTDVVPDVDVRGYRLRLVNGQELDIPYAALAGDDEMTATLDCTGGWYAEQTWQGVRLDRLLLDGAGSRPAGAAGGEAGVTRVGAAAPALPVDGCIEVTSVTGYRRRFPVSDASSLLLATRMAGEPLLAGHGAPVRLVAPGRRGFWWVKWVERVAVLDEPAWWQPPFPLQ
jgi:DMSO/TMAO reductase YedYZ molybdopterin-dependent catalytic subunit